MTKRELIEALKDVPDGDELLVADLDKGFGEVRPLVVHPASFLFGRGRYLLSIRRPEPVVASGVPIPVTPE